jgi:hypothetical protein
MNRVIFFCRNLRNLFLFSLLLVGMGVLRAEEQADPVQEVIETVRRNPDFDEAQGVFAELTPAMYDELYTRALRLTSTDKRKIMSYLPACYPGHAERRQGGISARHVIRYLVRHLNDSDSVVRNKACYELCGEDVADLYLRDFTPEVLDSVRKYPETQRAARLLGKLGCAGARELLLTPVMVEIMARRNPLPEGASKYEKWKTELRNRMKRYEAESPLAKVGDRELEWKLIREFREGPEEVKWVLTEHLGYIGSPGCVVELARAFLEAPYRARVSAEKPRWQRIADALHEALPQEPTFWFTYSFSGDISDYNKIKTWIKDYLGLD